MKRFRGTKYVVFRDGTVMNYNTKKVLTQSDLGNRYNRVNLSINGKQVRMYVHRLVAEVYLDNPENKKQVNHIDGNRYNNNVDNLEWCTRKENMEHAKKNGLTTKGKPSSSRKLSYSEAVVIKSLHEEGLSTREIARLSSINKTAIHLLISGQTYKDYNLFNENK